MTIITRLAYYWGYLPARLRMTYVEVKSLHRLPLPPALVKYRKALLLQHQRLYILHNKYDCWVITGYGKDGKPTGGRGFGNTLTQVIVSFLIANQPPMGVNVKESWYQTLKALGESEKRIKFLRYQRSVVPF